MGLTLNVGSGERTFDEYPDSYRCINVDVRNLAKTDVISNVRFLPFKNETFDYILASDIVEHFPVAVISQVLHEWHRLLKFGGVIEFRAPNLKFMAEHYLKHGNAEFISYHIFGGQDYQGNFHYVIFDRAWLGAICSGFGMNETEYREEGTNFIMKVKKSV